MSGLKTVAQVMVSVMFIFWAVVEFTKKSFEWPPVIVANLQYVIMGVLALGILLMYLYYKHTGNTKKGVNLVIFTAIAIVFFLLVRLLSK